jgi:hypothetical protein
MVEFMAPLNSGEKRLVPLICHARRGAQGTALPTPVHVEFFAHHIPDNGRSAGGKLAF